ncbi:MAG TPA: PAS domain-containing sensor histidine kinase [Caldisericia bacterium]|nr:PAS domain-containing sensor histidine kinase [Caldisericia bacterium]
MKHKLILYTFLSSLATFLATYLLVFATHYDKIQFSFFYTFFLPGLLICCIFSILFALSYWQIVERFFTTHVRSITSFERIDLIESWKKIIDHYESTIHHLKMTNQFTLSLMNQLTEGVLIFNQERKIVFTNQAFEKMLNDPVLLLEKYTWEVLTSYRLNEQIDQVIDTQQPAEGEFELHPETPKYLFYKVLPLSNFIIQKDKAEYLLILQDLTHLRKLEKVRTEFVSNVSHELKSPIAAIMGFSETLTTESLSPEKQTKYLKIIEKNAQKMSTIIQDLLILSRLENVHQLSKESFVLKDLLEEAINICRSEAQQKEIQLILNIDPQTLQLKGNPSLLLQVFRNLIENAIRYSPSQTKVEMIAQKISHTIHIQIQDQGYGIPAHEKERIFERFYRLDKSHSGDLSSGSGLGLSIVKHIMLLHQGSVSVDSKPGVGSTFHLQFPSSEL